MSRLSISVERRDGAVIVALHGEVDISETDSIQQALASVEKDQPAVMVLDLRDLTFLDSTGLRLVLDADARARSEGRRLALVPGPDVVHRVFQIALLDKRLEFIEDLTALGLDDADEA
jgi:anti-anti-sigma factor